MKSYVKHQNELKPEAQFEPTGVACPNCPKLKDRDEKYNYQGEMQWIIPKQKHYSVGREGEPGSIFSGMYRAICDRCGWKGFV
jgi:hypothetical protein